MPSLNKISGQILDIFENRIFSGEIIISNKKIAKIVEKPVSSDNLIAPGFIDAHIHIESSMLTPENFGMHVVKHGTIGLVCDPHEIANVLGVPGVLFMINNSQSSPLKFSFGAPSCVPATSFEDSGSKILVKDIEFLFEKNIAGFLSEMMNYPGVINQDPHIIEKINIAKQFKRNIDGHAPGLSGKDLEKYINYGISTDHECINIEEAIEKIDKGMYVLIREGSAAKNFNALYPLIDKFPERVMLCSDDLHPDDLIKGHINLLVKRAIKNQINLFNVWRAASYNPAQHYKLKTGLLRRNDPADFIVLEDKDPEKVILTVINGEVVYDHGSSKVTDTKKVVINNFNTEKIQRKDLLIIDKNLPVRVINAFEGELITKQQIAYPESKNGYLYADSKNDFLKICVLNRYKPEKPALGFIHGFNLKNGAIASSIAHDSHNIIAVGVKDEQIIDAVNWIIDQKGGIAVHDGDEVTGIPLPIAGIISGNSAESVAQNYLELNQAVKKLGCEMNSPFMTLSFMSLLVIPELKISNRGLFDVKNFSFTDLYEEYDRKNELQ